MNPFYSRLHRVTLLFGVCGLQILHTVVTPVIMKVHSLIMNGWRVELPKGGGDAHPAP